MYQWILHSARVETGKKVTRRYVLGILNDEYNKLADKLAKDLSATPQEKAREHLLFPNQSDEFRDCMT